MPLQIVHVDEIKLVGLSARTSNKDERNPATAKIGETVQYYFGHRIAEQIQHRKNPGRTLAVYTDYESDEHGPYTYFIGEEVSSIMGVRSPFQPLIISPGQYAKFTTPAGKMPLVVIEAWQAIWQMSPEDLGGKRAYRADFEVYDARAADPDQTIVDIYLGLK